MTFVSHAQNFEDVRLWRAFSDVSGGRYLDIGTQEPVRDSVSLAFYERGWRGVHVEPTPAYAARMRAARPDELVIEAAVSTAAGPMRFFEISGTGLSTGVADVAKRHADAGWDFREITVLTVTLAQLFDHMGPEPIHWLKIDVEGMEGDVLASWGDHVARPAALVIEATAPNTQQPTHQLWLELVTSRQYHEVLFDGLSRYFLHETHLHRAEAMALSPNVFDGFSVPETHFAAGLLVQEKQLALKTANDQLADQLQTAARERAALEQAAQQQAEAAVNQVRLFEEEQARVHAALAKAEAEQRAAAAIAAAQLAVLDADLREARTQNAHLQSRFDDQAVAHSAQLGELREGFEARIGFVELKLAEAGEALAAQRQLHADSMREAGVLEGRLRAQAEAHDARTAELQQQVDKVSKAHQLDGRRARADMLALQSQIAWREAQLAQATQLLSRAPNLLTGRPVVIARLVRWLAGRGWQHAAADHQAAVQQWQTGIKVPLPSMPQIMSHDSNIVVAQAGQEHEGGYNMDREGPITSVPRLLAPHDAAFIHLAYQAILGRAPDPVGGAHYLASLRAGAHKLNIVRQLRQSPEGRAFVPGVAGLDRAIKRHRWAALPVVGPVFTLFTGAEGDGPVQRQLRVIANDLARLRAEQREAIEYLKGGLQAFGSSIQVMPDEDMAAKTQKAVATVNPLIRLRPGLAGYFQDNLWNN